MYICMYIFITSLATCTYPIPAWLYENQKVCDHVSDILYEGILEGWEVGALYGIPFVTYKKVPSRVDYLQ